MFYEIAACYSYFHNFTRTATHTMYVRNKIFWKVFCEIVIVFDCNFKKGSTPSKNICNDLKKSKVEMKITAESQRK